MCICGLLKRVFTEYVIFLLRNQRHQRGKITAQTANNQRKVSTVRYIITLWPVPYQFMLHTGTNDLPNFLPDSAAAGNRTHDHRVASSTPELLNYQPPHY